MDLWDCAIFKRREMPIHVNNTAPLFSVSAGSYLAASACGGDDIRRAMPEDHREPIYFGAALFPRDV